MDCEVVVMTGIDMTKAEASGNVERYIEVHEEQLQRLTDASRQRAVINLDGQLCPCSHALSSFRLPVSAVISSFQYAVR